MISVIFMGTPDFSIPLLKGLIKNFQVLGVVTQPDRPAGRNQRVHYSAIKQLALQHELPVFQPEVLRDEKSINALKDLGIPSVYVVAAYGQLLPQSVLDIPKHGSINVHASLLPRWRGASPIQAAILHGDDETGITIMKMNAGLDTGPTLSMRRTPLSPQETGQSLHDRLAQMGADLLIETLPSYINGEIQPQIQDDTLATYAPQIEKEQGAIDWNRPAIEIDRQVRAFTPWPGSYCSWNQKRLIVLEGGPIDGRGEVGLVKQMGNKIVIGTAEGLYVPTRLQVAGGKPLPIQAFINGYRQFMGSMLS